MNPIEKHTEAEEDFKRHITAAALLVTKHDTEVLSIETKGILMAKARLHCVKAYAQIENMAYLENQTIEDVSSG